MAENNELEKTLWAAADKLRSNMDAAKYLAHNIFFVPEKARWQYLQDRAKQPEIGTLGDTFLSDKHQGLKADFILANPPFHVSDWSGEHLRDDSRWKYEVPSFARGSELEKTIRENLKGIGYAL